MKRSGLVLAVLYMDLFVLLILLLLNFVPVLRMQRQYRLERSVLDQAVMEQSEHMNRVAFALARFTLADARTERAGPSTERWTEAARALTSHASIALGSDLDAVDEILGDDPLLLRRRLEEADLAYSAATGRLIQRYERLAGAASAPEWRDRAEAFRREAARFLPASERRSRALMQLEGTVENGLRESRRLMLRNLRFILYLQLAGAVLLVLMVVLVVSAQTRRVRTLRGLIPICSSCKKVRNDRGYWNQVEQYVSEHSEASFSHGLCPDCMRRLYPDLAEEILAEAKTGTGTGTGTGTETKAR